MRVKRWVWVVLAIVAALFVAEHCLFETAAAPGAEYVIDLEALHRAAIATGALPGKIEVEQVGEFAFPQKLVIAGDSFRMHPMVLLVHRIVWPDRSLIIDSAMSPAGAKVIPGSKVELAAFERAWFERS